MLRWSSITWAADGSVGLEWVSGVTEVFGGEASGITMGDGIDGGAGVVGGPLSFLARGNSFSAAGHFSSLLSSL